MPHLRRTPRSGSPRCAALIITAIAGTTLTAAPVTWDGEAGDLLWFSDDNWEPNGVPGEMDTVTVESGGRVLAESMPVEVISVEVLNGLDLVSSSLTVSADSIITDFMLGGCCTTPIDSGAGTITYQGSNVFVQAPAFIGTHVIEGDAIFNNLLYVEEQGELTLSGNATIIGGGAQLRLGASASVTGTLSLNNATLGSPASNPDATWYFDGGSLAYTGTQDAIISDHVYVTSGTVSADTKELEFTRGFVFTDTQLVVSNGGRITLNPGAQTVGLQELGVTSFSGEGRVETFGSSIDLGDGLSTASVSGDGFWIRGLLKIGGELSNTAQMQLRGAILSGDGRLAASSGTLRVVQGAEVETDVVVRSGAELLVDAGVSLTKEIRIDAGGVVDLNAAISNTTVGPTIDPAVTVFGALRLPTGTSAAPALDGVKLALRGGGSVILEDRLLNLRGGGSLLSGLVTMTDTGASGYPRLIFGGDSGDAYVIGDGVEFVNDGGRGEVLIGNGVGAQPALEIDGEAVFRVTGPQSLVRVRVPEVGGSFGDHLVNEGIMRLERNTRMDAGFTNRADLQIAGNITLGFNIYENEANGVVTQTSAFSADTNATVTNRGEWVLPNSVQITPAPDAVPSTTAFRNIGLLRATGGVSQIDVFLVNEGEVIVDSAQLVLTDATTVDDNGRRVLSGKWRTVNNGKIFVSQNPPRIIVGDETEIEGDEDNIDFLDDIDLVEDGAALVTADLERVGDLLFDDGSLEVLSNGLVSVDGDLDAVGGSELTVNQGATLSSTQSIDVGSDDPKLPSVLDDLQGVITLARGTPVPPTVAAPLINVHANLTPIREDVGVMRTTGALTIHPTGTLRINAEGDGICSALEHSGDLEILGAVAITPIGGYAPALGDRLVIATVSGSIGTFPAQASADAGPGRVFALSVEGDQLVATVTADCPPDLNSDGSLNFFDVSVFLGTMPDYNNDGSFNFFDVSAFLGDFSAGCP